MTVGTPITVGSLAAGGPRLSLRHCLRTARGIRRSSRRLKFGSLRPLNDSDVNGHVSRTVTVTGSMTPGLTVTESESESGPAPGPPPSGDDLVQVGSGLELTAAGLEID